MVAQRTKEIAILFVLFLLISCALFAQVGINNDLRNPGLMCAMSAKQRMEHTFSNLLQLALANCPGLIRIINLFCKFEFENLRCYAAREISTSDFGCDVFVHAVFRWEYPEVSAC